MPEPALGSARLVLAGLRHYRRTHLWVVAGFALSAAVLVGALLVGDSVRGSLRAQALARVGQVKTVLASGDRFFRDDLAREIAGELEGPLGEPGSARCAPVLALRGTVSVGGGARRVNQVHVWGIDERFGTLAPDPDSGAGPAAAGPPAAGPPAAGEVLLGRRLAELLAVEPGRDVLLRVERPTGLSRDMVLAQASDTSIGLRLRVAGTLGEGSFGSFALAVEPLPPANAFVPLSWLQAQLELEGRANLLVTDGDAEAANAALARRWRLTDAQLELAELGDGTLELTSPRVFLDRAVAEAAARLERPVLGVLTYFVNALRRTDGEGVRRATPYSMVAGLGALGPRVPPALAEVLPATLGQDELVIGEWLAEDLSAGVGDRIELAYFVPGPDRRLRETARTLRVGAVVPLEGLAGDPTLLPAFPGLEGSAHCRDWEPGIPVDLGAIRDRDEAYWEEHRGTPKAFLPLSTAQDLWANRFGSLTALRAPPAPPAPDPDRDFAATLRAELDPAALGLSFRDLRGPALAASDTATDFGGLFIGLSLFLIVAALLLTALLFVFGVEQRAREIGTLLALGFPPARVRRLFFAEAALLGLVGTALGTALGTLCTRAVLRGLASVWSGAVASRAITYHGRPLTLVGGAAIAWLVALGATRWALRGQVRHRALELLESSEGVTPEAPAAEGRRARASLVLAALSVLAALAVGLAVDPSRGPAAAGAWFGAGSALLVAGLALSRWWLVGRAPGGLPPPRTVAGLGRRNGSRRPGRSLATVTLLACGTFLVVSIGAHRKSGEVDAWERTAGTGGFALFGRSTLPVHHDLNEAEGRAAFGLEPADLEGASVVSLRVHEGDEASCLNLGTPQAPRLVGVDPRELAERGAFTFASAPPPPPSPGAGELHSPWTLLRAADGDPAIPAIGDQASVAWVLHKKVGDTLDYVDDRGRPFQVRIVATVADSILQGSLVVDERALRERFPSEAGYRMFLIDAPPERAGDVSVTLGRALTEVGLELVPASQRLDEFHAVQNTFLDIFQLLGGLGVLLGSVGVGVVVLRNALERRRELSTLIAVGFSRGALHRLLLAEHLPLLALGLGGGTLAALMALVPVGAGAAASHPLVAVLPLVAAMVVNGALWVTLACAAAVRGDHLSALRHE